MSDNQARGMNRVKQICTKEGLKARLKYYYYLFHLLDLTVGVLLCIDGYVVISTATLDSASSFSRFVIPIYYFIFGFTMIALTFYVPPFASVMAMFYWTSFGRCFILLFLSVQLMSFASSLDIAVGIFVGTVALLYFIFACLTIAQCPVLRDSLPPPILQRFAAEKEIMQPNQAQVTKLKNQNELEQKDELQSLHMVAINSGSAANINRISYGNEDIQSDEEMKDKVAGIPNKDLQIIHIETQTARIQNVNLKNVDTSNAVEKMINLGLLSHIFVKKNVFQRYAARNTYWNMLVAGNANEEKGYDCDYIKMHVLNMTDNDLLTNLSEEQVVEFEKLLLYSLESVDKLYMIQFTRTDLNSILLQKIIKTLIERSKDVTKFGPEEFHCDSNVGMECIEYIAENDKDLKVIKVAINNESCKLCADVLSEKNEYLLQFCIDVECAEYQTKIDQALMRNNGMFRKENSEKKQMHKYHETVGIPDNLLEMTSNFTLPESEAPDLIAGTQFPPIQRVPTLSTEYKAEEKTYDKSTDEIDNGYVEVVRQDNVLRVDVDVEVRQQDSSLIVDENVMEEVKEEILTTDNGQLEGIDHEVDINDIQVVANGDDVSRENLESGKMSTDWTFEEESSLVQEVGLYLKVNMMNVKEMSKQDWKAIAGQHNENFWENTGFKGRLYKDCKSRYKKVGSLLHANDGYDKNTPQTDGDDQMRDYNMIHQSAQYQVVSDHDNFV